MDDFDIEPVQQPDPGRIRDALQKGLGRAVLWAKTAKWTDKSLLREGCLNDLRYDRQVEEPRGPWLWQLMGEVGAVDDFREDILASLFTLDDGLAAQQRCQLALFYAKGGDERFRRELQRIVVEKPVPDCPRLGDDELIALDGEAGFLLAAKARGSALLNREWDWDDRALIDTAVEKLGEPAVAVLLDREAASSREIARFREQWRLAAEPEPQQTKQSHADRMRQYTIQDVIHAAEVAKNQGGFLRGWGMYADEGHLRAILDRLLTCQNSETLANYLRVFSNRALPDFDKRMLALLNHGDEQVRRRACTAVAQNAHPAIRRFALEHLQERIADPNFAELFIKNWQPGDEHRFLSSIRVPEDEDDCHGLMMDTRKMLEQNAAADCSELGLLIYRVTPCAECRFSAVKLLVEQKVAPPWLIEECRWDCIADTRELVSVPPAA